MRRGGGAYKRGDLVAVRRAGEILATLDANGATDSLPFMPEMVAACGQVFTVDSQASKVCDTATADLSSRRIPNAVLLDGQRCDGSGHGGCQSACLTYWNEAWLRPATDPSRHDISADDEAARAALLERVGPAARQEGDVPRYRCQATELVAASTRLSASDPRVYLNELTSGNVGLGRFARVMARAGVMQPLHSMGRLNEAPYAGPSEKSPPRPAPLDLQPGEWVRVRSVDEIRATLTNQGRNRGLWFDREMAVFCGEVFQVRERVTRIVDERDGSMLEFGSDCITLENNWCTGDRSTGRWFCPRKIYGFWRECWLERADPPD